MTQIKIIQSWHHFWMSTIGISDECQPSVLYFYSIMKALAYNELQHSTITLHYILNLISQLLRVRLVGSSHCKMRQTDIAGLTWITNFKIRIYGFYTNKWKLFSYILLWYYLPKLIVSPRKNEEHTRVVSRDKGCHTAKKTAPFFSMHHAWK